MLNRFAYTLNNPVRYSDPTGHVCYDPVTDAATPGNCNGGSTPLPRKPELKRPDPVFHGLPINPKDVKWANGFGANSYANRYANPESLNYDKTYKGSGGIHPGLDFGLAAGTSVYSNVYGTVIKPSPYPGDAGYPANVVILLDNGMSVIFGHVVGIDSLEDGMRVSPGDLIGTIGDQGDNSHLHLAIRQTTKAGERVYNPANYFVDSTVLNEISWSGYVDGENLYSISSFLYQPTEGARNFWTDGAEAIGVIR